MNVRPAVSLLRLFGLLGFAVAVPVLGVLKRHPQFLVAHGTSPGRLLALTAAVLLLLPLAVWALEQLAGLFGRRARGAAHLAAIGAAAAACLIPPIGRALPGAAALAAGIAAGAAAAAAYARFPAVRTFASWSAAVPLAYAALFHADEQIAKFSHVSRPLPVEGVRAAAPVVMVVFDELPVFSLLDGEQRIDARLAPNFAAFARHATWFRSATTVSGTTKLAIPAILTGLYPDAARLPVAADYPANLFTLLRGTHDMHVRESRTILHPEPSAQRAAVAELRELASDLSILYAHFFLPRAFTGALPPVDLDWRGFASDPAQLEAVREEGATAKLEQYLGFVHGIEACAEPCLYFVHTVLPHVPWMYTPEGRSYTTYGWIPGLRKPDALWGSEERWVVEGYQRHLFQVALADKMLGELLGKLVEVRLFDRALVVVVADHGSSFWPGTARRDLAGHPHPEDILRVPLLVKAPGQRAGRVDDRPVETVDILPTMADLLGVELPWRVDGRSAAAPGAAPRGALTGFANSGERLAFDPALLAHTGSLERKLALFDPARGRGGLYALGPHRELVGRSLTELEVAPQPGMAVELVGPWLPVDQVPPRIIGRFLFDAPRARRPHVAVAVGDEIASVAATARAADGHWVFSVFVPDERIGAPRDGLAVFAIEGPVGAESLRFGHARSAPLKSMLGNSWTPE